ncbi:MAG: TetR/AcrR family transcriptional regulator [Ignavibacteriales bacterium]|nr:MAG: TetR/AcrR family transcriptional regulator [Ignavibacteriales bacterium]
MKKLKITSEDQNPEKIRIVNFASEVFLRDGFFKISMDRIASDLHISKKTIYKFFSTKEELVEAVISNFITSASSRIESVMDANETSLTKALKLFEIMGSIAMRLSDNWIKDIKIHTPDLWEKIDEFRTKKAFAVLGNIIRQGQTEGMIIDKPAELIIYLFVNSIRSIVNPDFLFYQKFNYKEAFQHSFEILFNGILTQKGKKQFDKIFSKVIQ